ncbi:phage tail tape measure protein [Lachnospiraceae bacterium 62-26]
MKNAAKNANGFGNFIKGFAKFGIYFNVFQKIEQGAGEAVKAIEDVDKAIVDLQMATGDSYNNVRQLVSGYNDFAKQLGATTKEVASGASDWLRQGKSIVETNKLIQDSMVLSKVSNLSSEDSTSYLTAMMKGYKKSAEEVSEINDALTSIDLAAAVDAGGLAEATSRVAASADLAGVSLNRLLGYEAAVGEAAQGNMSIVGNSLKAIFTRMSSIKAGNLELIDEDGTIKTLSDVETVLNNIGVQLRSSANEFRDFDDVLDDVAERWDNLSSVQQSSVSQAFAGTYQANRFKLLMENYDTALKYEKIANESSGIAMQKFNDAYLNSIEAKQKSLQASFEGLSVNLVSRDSINGILEATQALVEFLDKTNLLKGALTGLAMGSVLKGFVALTASITQASMKMHNFQQMLSMARTGNIGADIEKIKLLTEGLSASQLKAIVSTKELSLTQRMAILEASGMSKAQAQATLSTMGLATAEAGATGSTLSLSAAFKGLWNTLLANPIILLSTALTVGMMAWSSYKQSIEDSIQKATDATSAWKESNNAISEQTAKYKELKSQLDSGTLTPSEEYETRKQILDIQTQITSEYGNQVSGIDLVNGSLQTQLGLLQQISAEEAKETLNENREEYKNAEEQMIKDRKYILGNTRAINQDNLRKDIENIVKSFEKEGIYLEETGDGSGTKTIFFDGDASLANESINGLMNKIEELKSKYTDEDSINVLDYILNQSGESLNENKKILEDYQDNYKTFLQMDMISKGTGKGSVAGTFNEYTEAVQKYNEALSNGDTETINKARSDFASLSAEVDKLLSKEDNGKFAILFDDMLDQLNDAGIKAYDFQEILSGKENNKNQFNKISGDIKDASDKLKGLKLDAVDALDALLTEGMQVGESELLKLAEAWGLSAESTEDEIQSFIDVLLQAGIVSGEVADSAEIASKSFDTYSTSVQKAKEELETLKSIMSESNSGSGISAENVTAFREMFGSDAVNKALEKTANGYHLNKQALAELQVQMDTMTKADYLSALSDQYTELQNIEGKISAAEILGQDTSGLQASKNGILDNITSLQDLQYQYEAATSAYQQWQSAMSGGEEGDMYDSIYGNIEKAEELYDKGLTGTNAFREFVDLMSNKDLSTASNEEIIAAYESAMPVIKRYFTEGQEGAQNFLNDIQNINSEWAHMNEDGSWDINFGMGQDQDIADALNMDVEAVQTILRKLSDYGFEINLDEPVASLETLKSQAESASETLSNLGDNINIDLEVDSFDGVDKQISSVKDYINEIKNSDLDLDVKTDKLDAANSILEYLVARKQEIGQSENVDITLNINEQELQSGYNILNQLKSDLVNIQGKVGIDTTGLQTDINNCVAQIEAMSPEMKVALGIQGMSVEQIKAGLMDGSIQVPVDADTAQANSDIDTVKNNNIDDKKFSITANNSQALASIAVVRAYLSGITNKSVTVTVNKVTNETTNKSSGASPASGISSHMVNGTAHAQGTAFARGNWGNPTAGKKLVGELGREIVVNTHTGQYYTVGDNGAEFVEIPKNAIVFNHLQTESLLNNGHIVGRGKALVSGTALSNGTGKFNVGGSGSKSSSTTKKSYSSSSSKSNSSNSSSDSSDKADEFKETIDYIEMKIDRIERQIKNLERVAGSAYNTFSKRNTALRNQISSITEEISTQQAGYDRYIQQANSVSLDENYKSQVRNGAIDISTITDETLAENIKEYQQWYEKALDCRDAVEELRESVRDLYTEAFDNVVTMYDGILGQIEHKRNILEGYIDQTEAQGYIISTKYYDTLISNELNNLEELTKERQDLINAMNDAIVNGNIEEGSEQWYEFQSEINDVNESIQEANTSLIEFGNSIRDIEWEVFDKIQDRISGITDESDFLVKLLSSNKLFDDKGLITDEGKATMGLHGVNYNTYMSQADEYRKEMEKIQSELAKDPYNQTLVDRRKELLELQQESILAAEDEKEAIKDLVEDGINKQLDSLKDLIDKYTDMMDTQKDMYDYQKEIAEKQKKINEVEKQFLSFQGDDSEEGAATRQELKNELNELKADLEETQYSKSIAEQKKLLDELYTEYETVLNMRLDNIDLLIMDVTGNVNSESTAIRDTIVSEAESVGYKLTDTMTTVWTDNTNKLTGVITTYGDKFTSSLTGVQTAINELKALIQQAVNASDEKAKTNIDNANKQQTEQTSRPTVPKPPTPTPKPSSSNSDGDGVPRVGDAVTFANGKYFYSSDGKAPNGSQMLGQTVYITKINNASWAKKPYHISKGSRLGANDLGWVSLDQLKGYKTGAKSIDKDQWAWTNEDAPETVIRKSDGAVLTRVNRGDQIYNSTATKRMWDMANNPTDFISRYYHAPSADDMQSAVRQNATTIQNDIHVEFNLDNVQDPEDFLRFIQKDEKAHKLLQTMMFAELSGRGHFEKFKIKI